MSADPRSAYSFRHARSGEWAHPLHSDPIADARASYVDPAWEALAARVRATPAGPAPSRPWRAVVIGFGRGFECIALEQRLAAEAPASCWEVVGLEPFPEALMPWPPRWSGLAEGEAPWWGQASGGWSLRKSQRTLQIKTQRMEEWSLRTEAKAWDCFLLDLFSPAKHPEDWEPRWAEGLARVAAPGAVLAGYSCARSVREALTSAGWEVEVLRRKGLRDSLVAHWKHAGPS